MRLITKRELQRQRAVLALLALPDEPCLRSDRGGRAHALTCHGDLRRAEIVKRDIGRAFIERRRHEHGRDISRASIVAEDRESLKIRRGEFGKGRQAQ